MREIAKARERERTAVRHHVREHNSGQISVKKAGECKLDL